jgi:hypothetical protein
VQIIARRVCDVLGRNPRGTDSVGEVPASDQSATIRFVTRCERREF